MTLESEAGEVIDPTGSPTALIQLSDLDDRLEVAAKESRRRAVCRNLWSTLHSISALQSDQGDAG